MSLISSTDNIYATRVLKLLLLPFEKQQAFKLGIIDKVGNKIKDPKNQDESDNYDYLHQLIFKLKQVINNLPSGNTRLTQLALALKTIRQRILPGQYKEDIVETVAIEYLNSLIFLHENSLCLLEEELEVESVVNSIYEEGEIANTTANVEPHTEPVIDPKKNKKKEDIVTRTPLAEESHSTLYVQRKLINTQPFVEWAKSVGFETTLTPEDIHCTICYSRNPVSNMEPDMNQITISGGKRSVTPLGDKGAYVLRFDSAALQKRWKEFIAAGASWDYDSYNPHVTISYSPRDTKWDNQVSPYTGDLVFGPEIFEELNEDWADTVKEE